MSRPSYQGEAKDDARRGRGRRRWLHRLDDMLLALDRAQSYIAGMDRAQFLADRRTIDAVVRNLEILGEAVRHVPESARRRHGAIPWLQLRELRNFLAHEYFGVDDAVVWETVSRNLAPLRPALQRMRAEEHD